MTALGEERRPLVAATLGVATSIVAFAFVFGVAASQQGLSLVETMALSMVTFAGASQLAAVGYLAQGLPWLTIVALTALLNARHLLYAASLGPGLRDVRLRTRLAMAQVLTDEAFALSAAHFARIGRADVGGYWIAAVLGVYVPWNLGTLLGAVAGGGAPDPARLGLDVAFPAVMAGLAVGLTTRRVELVAALSGAFVGVLVGVLAAPAAGVVAGALAGPAIALATCRTEGPA